ncbi:enoyl-[acyl-carrier-protein] reductase, mitochondrial-like [Diabrotica undecimpunctata]|uniref:enoyl-[acyl-carrier-protein] reductase, mitochondrial-like n=1 Tax=Diabrotica undecimpunctata TaxID=50387 RepID=UPI003B635E17
MLYRTARSITFVTNNFINNERSYLFKRNFASKLIFNEYGNPVDVVKKITVTVPEPSSDEVLVEVLSSPVNPVDINIIQGKYPVKKIFPAVPGSEAVGKVIKVGKYVKDFKEGDHVVPLEYNLGTWTTHMVLSKSIIKMVPNSLPVAEAAILITNPPTAYRMLKDFVKLKKGDTVIQNAANSSCGQLILQLCKMWGINSVNVIRDRPNISELKQQLKTLGATHVLTEEEFRTTDIFKSGTVPKPKLALNCVGGQSSTELLRKLDQNGTLVTYGGMSMQPVKIPVSALIFKNISFVGFSVNIWNSKTDIKERNRMLDELICMFMNGDLKIPPFRAVGLDNFQEALEAGLLNKSGKKYLLEINK